MGRIAILLLVLTSFESGAFETPRQFFGTLRGVLRHNALQRDQLAKLDFVVDRKNGGSLELMAVLTLRFGNESSGEYVSYAFDAVTYNVFTTTLVFEQGDQGLTLVVNRYDGRRLEAVVRGALLDPEEATLILDRDGGVTPKYPLVGEVGGIYRGDDRILDLRAFRSTEERLERENPFAEYDLRGKLARYHPDLGGMVVDNNFTGGSYDFFKGRLILTGGLEPMVCKVDVDELTCDGERFRRELAPTRAARATTKAPWVDAAQEPLVEEPGPSTLRAFSGRYWGYLHHEARGTYQLLDLNLTAFPATASGSLSLSAIASLHFGDPANQESLCYKFEPKEYNFASRVVVFRRPSQDPLIQITSIQGNVLRGIWYSKLFGRVGTFELHRGKPPAPPKGAVLVPSLSGIRDGDIWRLQLRVVPRPMVSRSSNPFAPLTFTGLFWDRHQVVLSKSPITGGSYDFYTGRISLPVTAANESVFLFGEHGTDGGLGFSFHLSNRFGSSFRPQQVLFTDPKQPKGNSP